MQNALGDRELIKKVLPYVIVLALGVAAVVTAMFAGKDYEPFRFGPARTEVVSRGEPFGFWLDGPTVEDENDYAVDVVTRIETLIIEIEDVQIPAGNIHLEADSREFPGMLRDEIYADVVLKELFDDPENAQPGVPVYAVFRDGSRVYLAAGWQDKNAGKTAIDLYFAEDGVLYTLGSFSEKPCYDTESGRFYLQEENVFYEVDGYEMIRSEAVERPRILFGIPFMNGYSLNMDAAALNERIVALP